MGQPAVLNSRVSFPSLAKEGRHEEPGRCDPEGVVNPVILLKALYSRRCKNRVTSSANISARQVLVAVTWVA